MINNIKAIETSYRGFRFRSRTEARWAVFFDAAGVAWDYEPEGFVLPSGRYLPDFRLLDSQTGRTWLEVKGTAPTQREKDLMLELCLATRAHGVIVVGRPEEIGDAWFTYEYEDGSYGIDDAGQMGPFDGTDFLGAIAASRAARFEFGETGVPA